MNIDEKPFQVYIKKNTEPIRPVAIFAFLMVLCMPIHTITIGGIGIFMLIGLPLFALSIPAFLNRLKYTIWDKATLVLAAYFFFNILAYLWAPRYSLNSLYNYLKIIVMVMCLYVLCLNRDTMVQMPILGIDGRTSGTTYAQLALSHTYGEGLEDSCENTQKTVEALLNHNVIDHYVAMNMDAISIVNDAVGGVTVTITDIKTIHCSRSRYIL